MGAWGTGSFENDDASDWVYDLEGSTDASVVRAALTLVATAGDDAYVERPEAACAIAAGEVVAAATGSPGPQLPEDVGRWLGLHGASITEDLRELAVRGVTRARAKSELRELWDEAGDEEWLALTADLLGRLA